MDDDHDPAEVSHWPKELLICCEDDAETQVFSLALVKDGLKSGDLESLAKHLRNGLPIPDEIANLIADAIDRNNSAPCHIVAKKLRAGRQAGQAEGRKNKRDGLTHGDKMQIGFAVDREIRNAEAGEFEASVRKVSAKYHVGRTSTIESREYFLKNISKLAKAYCENNID